LGSKKEKKKSRGPILANFKNTPDPKSYPLPRHKGWGGKRGARKMRSDTSELYIRPQFGG